MFKLNLSVTSDSRYSFDRKKVKAGLEKVGKGKTKSSQSPVAFDPADFLLDDEID